jgi:hypothetical protein
MQQHVAAIHRLAYMTGRIHGRRRAIDPDTIDAPSASTPTANCRPRPPIAQTLAASTPIGRAGTASNSTNPAKERQ